MKKKKKNIGNTLFHQKEDKTKGKNKRNELLIIKDGGNPCSKLHVELLAIYIYCLWGHNSKDFLFLPAASQRPTRKYIYIFLIRNS